ncbi:MAG TPA: hypothetical protein VF789_24750 [Thermoanaerobaculia bacterium]
MTSKAAFAALSLSLVLTASAAAETVVSDSGSSFGNSAIAVTGRGDLVIVWEAIDDRSSSHGVFAQLYDAAGRPRGPVFLAHSEIFGYQTNPKVAADQAGNFVVAWQGGGPTVGNNTPGGDGDLTGIFVQRFDSKGRRQGRQIRVNREIAGYQVSPVVAMDRNGSFVVAWYDCPVSTLDCGLRAQSFAAAGARKGPEVKVDLEAGDSFSREIFVAMTPEGFSVGWTEYDPIVSQTSEITPVIARFTPAGRPVGAPFRLSDGQRDGQGWTLAGLGASEASSAALFRGGRNSIQVFSPEGDPLGSRKIVGKRAPCLEDPDRDHWCETPLALAMNASGQFAVVWFVDRTDIPFGPTRLDIWAQLFDADGQPRGERFQVNRDYEGAHGVSAVLSDSGVLTVLWQGRRLSDSGVNLVFRRFRLQ